MKLQYFGFWKQTRKKTYQKDFKAFALHCIGWVGGGAQFKLLYKLVLALRTYNELQKLARKWTCKVCILPPPPPRTHTDVVLRIVEVTVEAEQSSDSDVRCDSLAKLLQYSSEGVKSCPSAVTEKKRLAPFSAKRPTPPLLTSRLCAGQKVALYCRS